LQLSHVTPGRVDARPVRIGSDTRDSTGKRLTAQEAGGSYPPKHLILTGCAQAALFEHVLD